MNDRIKHRLRLFIFALFAGTLFFGAQLTVWLKDPNRYSASWTRMHDLALIADIVLLSLVAFGIAVFLEARRLEWLRRAYASLYPLALTSPVIAMLPLVRNHPLRAQFLWVLAALIVVFFHVRRWTKPLQFVKSLALVFSPIIPILFFQLLTAPCYGTLPEPMRFPRPAPPGARPVLLIVFDEWSYLRSTQDGGFLPTLTHLRALSGCSFFFRRAQSEEWWTHVSVPKILYQTDGLLTVRKGKIWFAEGERRTPSRDMQSLLAVARDDGYNTCALGFHVPYRYVLGDQADFTFESPKHGGTLLESMKISLLENLKYLPDPLSLRFQARADDAVIRHHMIEATYGLNRETLRILRQGPKNLFIFLHAPGAHAPFIFHPDGTHREILSKSPEHYVEQIHYVDNIVGQFVQACRDAGKYDDAMIILTGDHSWRFDPDPKIRATPGSAFHVPLVMKWPGQTTARVVDRPFSLIQLKPLVELALRGGSEQQALAMINAAPTPKPHGIGPYRDSGFGMLGLR